jgi:Hsp70 protein
VYLGQVASPFFRLRASADAALTRDGQPGIEVSRWEIKYDGEVDNWLRIIHPAAYPVVVQPPPASSRFNLMIDTTSFNRQEFDGRLLYAELHLYDFLNRRITCEIRARLKRWPSLNHFLAIDWGTTNTCAAYRAAPTEQPRGVKFHRDQPSLEIFPSEVYFRSIEDPENPDFLLGFDATQLAKSRPECCLRSLKRRFQFDDTVRVRDEAGRRHPYPIEKLVELILLQLVTMAEGTLQSEVGHVSLTFPTKWNRQVRDKLGRVAKAVERRLQKVRPGASVEVLPPVIDEANAVALHFVTSERDLPEHFHLIAFDFGGGTVDTAVLEVRFANGKFTTTHFGIGGCSDLGGDDVTRAVMQLLEQRLGAALQGRSLSLDGSTATVTFQNILTLPTGADQSELNDHAYLIARANWDSLWEAAEAIKIELCKAAPPESEAKPPAEFSSAADSETGIPVAILSSPADGAIRRVLATRTGTIFCQVVDAQKTVDSVELDKILRGWHANDLNAFYQRLSISLEDVYDLELNSGQAQASAALALRKRIEDTVLELFWQCNARSIKPKYIVLAGGASRLPLVEQLIGESFGQQQNGGPVVIFDNNLSKQRVSHGLASYLFLFQAQQHLDGLSRSVDILHHPIGLMEIGWWEGQLASKFQTIVPAGSLLDDSTWHAFTFANLNSNGQLPLYWQVRHDNQQSLGFIDFTRCTSGLSKDEPCRAEALPLGAGPYEAELRLRGLECLEVRVTVRGQRYGHYLVRFTISDPEAALQC